MAYTSAQLSEKIKQIVAKEIGVDESEITPKANFVDDLGADSLDVVELVIAFEESFDIEISEDDAEKMHTVEDVQKYLEKRLKV